MMTGRTGRRGPRPRPPPGAPASPVRASPPGSAAAAIPAAATPPAMPAAARRAHAPIILRVRRVGLREQELHLGSQLLRSLAHATVGHRLVLRRVGLDLRAVERHAAQRQRAGFQGQPQHLLEQAAQRGQMPFRKSLIVRKSGWLPAASTRNASLPGDGARSSATRRRRRSTRRPAPSSSSPGGTAAGRRLFE
jgi:hypothetical protein